MKKTILFLLTGSMIYSPTMAQVADVSVIVTPTGSYNWFDKKSTIDNGFMYGFQAGFGFGQFLELRGIYEKSLDMKQNFGEYQSDINNLFPNYNLKDRKIDLNRIGGEFKGNIPLGRFSPYLLLGTGVQTVTRNSYITNVDLQEFKLQSLYGSGGLGFKLNLFDRVTLNVEGRGIVYNLNPSSLLYDVGGDSQFDEFINNQERSRMFNWSATAGLQFYLGGTRTSGMSELDKAYMQRFSSGISGLKFTFAPGGAYTQFDKESPLRSTYMLGGTVGFDVTDLIGFRGFYYHATQGDQPSLNFDKMAMYGGEFVGKLNVPRGIVPFVTVGGGYIDVQDDYQGKAVLPGVGLDSALFRSGQSGYFAKGGVGATIPLFRNMEAFAAANILYTIEDQDVGVTDLRSASQLRQHTMYNVGLRFNVGKNIDTDKAYDRSLSPLKESYNAKLADLEKELANAYKNNDAKKAAEIIEEKKKIEQAPMTNIDNELIRMTPQELESIIDKVIREVEDESVPSMENRLDRLEQLLLNLNRNNNNTPPSPTSASVFNNNAVNDRLMGEIQKLNEQIRIQNAQIESLRLNGNNTPTTTIVTSEENVTPSYRGTIDQGTEKVTGLVLSKGYGAYIGTNFGEGSTVNLGLRAYYGFSNTNLLFMPEAYFAIGEKNGFGLSANGVLPFNFISVPYFQPYAGLGFGVHNINNNYSFNTNVIIGTAYKIGKGSLFADYTARGLFKNNQIAVGYRFSF